MQSADGKIRAAAKANSKLGTVESVIFDKAAR